jgi:tetratricopeptide (TPR) repeat protein
LLDLASNYSVSGWKSRIERAESLLHRALEKQPDFANAHFYLGRLYKVRTEYPLAQQSFLRALELNPSLSLAYAQLGHTLARQGRAREGMEHVLYAIKLSPKDPSIGFAYFFAGEAALELGDYDLAQHWLLRAHASLPGSSPFVHGWLAAVYALDGNASQASKHAAVFKSVVSEARIAGLLRHLKREAAHGQRRRLLEGLELALRPSP